MLQEQYCVKLSTLAKLLSIFERDPSENHRIFIDIDSHLWSRKELLNDDTLVIVQDIYSVMGEAGVNTCFCIDTELNGIDYTELKINPERFTVGEFLTMAYAAFDSGYKDHAPLLTVLIKTRPALTGFDEEACYNIEQASEMKCLGYHVKDAFALNGLHADGISSRLYMTVIKGE